MKPSIRLTASIVLLSLLPTANAQLSMLFYERPEDTIMALTAEAPSDARRFRLTEPVEALTILVVGTEEIDVVIVSPDGVARTPEQIAAAGGSFEQNYSAKPMGAILTLPAGHYYNFMLPSPAVGLYVIRAAAKETPAEPIGVVVMPMPLGAEMDAIKPARGPEITFRAPPSARAFAEVPIEFTAEALADGEPVADADISYRFVSEQGEQIVRLLDDGLGADAVPGDGVYSGSYTPAAPGMVEVYGTGSMELLTTPEQIVCAMEVVVARARMVGDPTAEPQDQDGDGRFETFAVSADIDVLVPGEYLWTAYVNDPPTTGGPFAAALSSASDDLRFSRTAAQLGAGRHRLTATFPLFGGLPENSAVVVFDAEGHKTKALSEPNRPVWGELFYFEDEPPLAPPDIPQDATAERRELLQRIWERQEQTRQERRMPLLIQRSQGIGSTPDLPAEQLAEPPIRLTSTLQVVLSDANADGRLEDIVLSGSIRLAPGVTLRSASVLASRPAVDGKGPLQAQTQYGDITSVEDLKIVIPGARITASQFSGPARVDLTLESSGGSVSYAGIANLPAFEHSQFAVAEPSVLSITPTQFTRGQTARIVVRTQGIDVEPSAWGPRFEIEDATEAKVISSGEPDSFFVDVEVPPYARPASFDVEIVARNFRQTFPDAFTVLGFPVQFTGNNRTYSHDSDGDGIPDKIAWELEVESASAVRVVGGMRLRTGARQYLPLPETTLPEGKSFVRFFATGYGQFNRNTPDKMVGAVTLREAGARNGDALSVQTTEPELRAESLVEHFVWPRMGVNGEITAREADDDGDGLFDRVVFRVPFTAEDKAPLADVRLFAKIHTEDNKFQAKAFGSAELLENGANVVELSLDGEELSAAGVNGPLQVVGVELTAKNFFWRHIPLTASVTTQPFSGANFRPARPRLVRMFADGEGGRELPIAVAGSMARVSVLCKFAECPEEGLQVSSSGDVSIEEIESSGGYVRLNVAVADYAPDGWRPISIQTSAGLLTLPEAFLVQRPE